ncbi:MAG: Uncharacterised protein [Flavobacterium sp. SCGC AAA160-P02]|nr:MAG: Uncharacterised protein [Flavobacterium sp. SCGC AAA160-P02]
MVTLPYTKEAYVIIKSEKKEILDLPKEILREDMLPLKMEFFHKNLGFQPKQNGSMLPKQMLKIENTILSGVRKSMPGVESIRVINQRATREISWQTLNNVKEVTVVYQVGPKTVQIFRSK